MHRLTLAVLLSALLTMPAVGFAAPKASVAIYEVTFQRTWSEATHPVAWPGTAAHFTGAIGATHNGKYAMFAAGGIATPGLEVLSQTGSSSPFDSELEAAKRKGFVGTIFTLDPIRDAGGSATAEFEATDAHSMVSFASMLAPSPDWFTGIASVPLKRNGKWIETETIAVYAWDSGTNAATTYRADKVAVDPFVPITVSDAPMFVKAGAKLRVGTVTIRRVLH